jgi:hypothetical protein
VFELVLNTSNVHFQQLDMQYAARDKIVQQLDSLWAQLSVTLAVLNLGIMHACAQLFVCMYKTHGATSYEMVELLQRRSLIIFLGLVFPCIVPPTTLLSQGEFLPLDWTLFVLWTTVFLPTTTVIFYLDGVLQLVQPIHKGPIAKFLEVFFAFILAASLMRCGLGLGYILAFQERVCLIVPCTPVKITEMDQAFALFVALLCFLYEFSAFFLSFFKVLRLRVEKCWSGFNMTTRFSFGNRSGANDT